MTSDGIASTRWALAILFVGLLSSSASAAEADWRPLDATPRRVFISGKRFVVAYQFRLLFGEMTPDISTAPDAGAGTALTRAGQPVDPLTLPGTKIWTFSHPYAVLESAGSSSFLICTAPHIENYTVKDRDERKRLGRRKMPWTDRGAKYKDFCGIVNASGDEIFRFPYEQKRPRNNMHPLAFSSDGLYAAVVIGEEVEGEESTRIGKWREIWTWEFPRTLKKNPGPWKNGAPKNETEVVQQAIRQYSEKPRQK